MENQEHVCVVCSYVYPEEINGPWDDLPETYTCPECGVGKEEFVTI